MRALTAVLGASLLFAYAPDASAQSVQDARATGARASNAAALGSLGFSHGAPLPSLSVSSGAAPSQESLPEERFRLLLEPGTFVGQQARATAPDIVHQAYAQRHNLRACVETLPGRAPASERIEVRLALRPEGSVSNVQIDSPPGSMVDPICVMVMLSQVRFTAPREALTLRFPMELRVESTERQGRPRAHSSGRAARRGRALAGL